MAANFRIVTYRNKENVHIKLMGDFDGSSAWELINALRQNCTHANKIIIHTGGLSMIYPFGMKILQKNLFVLKGQYDKLVFTGENKIEPDRL